MRPFRARACVHAHLCARAPHHATHRAARTQRTARKLHGGWPQGPLLPTCSRREHRVRRVAEPQMPRQPLKGLRVAYVRGSYACHVCVSSRRVVLGAAAGRGKAAPRALLFRTCNLELPSGWMGLSRCMSV